MCPCQSELRLEDAHGEEQGESDLLSRVWNNCSNAVHTMRAAMAIKLLCKLMHEIERALSKECQG
jgi:hypothetical protein